MISEKLEPSAELVEEWEDIKAVCPDFKPRKAFRLSFFKAPFGEAAEISSDANGDFIGYAILTKDYFCQSKFHWRIYESVLKPSGHENNCVRGIQKWCCCVNGIHFDLEGYLYAQQSGLTNRCGHVALRTVLSRYSIERVPSYREINDIVRRFRQKSGKSPKNTHDITVREMMAVLKKLDVSCFDADFELKNVIDPPVPFQKYLYGSIESGYPAIVIFKTLSSGGHHAIPVFGHTFNEDSWVQRANSLYFTVGEETKYIPSESLVSMYIAHDDNWGPNYCIPRRYLHARRFCDKLANEPDFCQMQNECVMFVIGTMPKKVKLDAIRAETIGSDYLLTLLKDYPKKDNVWGNRLIDYAQQNLLVLRPILVNSEEYIKHLRKVRGWDYEKINEEVLEAIKPLLGQEKLWMIELSVPELFSANKRKVGEVLLRAEKPASTKRDFENYVLARLPGYVGLYKGTSASEPDYLFKQSGIPGHVELFGCEE